MNYISLDIGSRLIHFAVNYDGTCHVVHTYGTIDTFSIPSTAYKQGGGVLVGHEAEIWSRYFPDNTIETSVSVQQDYATYLPSFLKYVKELAERQFGVGQYGLVYLTPIDYYDSDPRKKIVEEKAKEIGFFDVKFMRHSNAVCASYKFADQDRIMVCDYGHEKFKVSLLRYDNDDLISIGSKASESYCGMYSDSIVRTIIEEAKHIDYFDGVFFISQSRAIDDLCVRIKEELSYSQIVQYPIPFTDTICYVKREEFERRIHDAVYETIKESSALVAEKGLEWDDINAVVFTGGASLSPCILQLWKKYISAYNKDITIVIPTSSEQAIYGACLNALSLGEGMADEKGAIVNEGGDIIIEF